MWLASNQDLLARFRRGEPKAMGEVFRHYVDDVVITIRSGVVVGRESERIRVGTRLPEVEIEALVQETFTRAFAPQARQSYDGIRAYSAWLGTIARNLMVDRARRLRRDRGLQQRLESEEQEPIGPIEPTWSIDLDRMRAILEQLESTLSGDEQRIFRARYREEMSLREAATSLDLGVIRVRRIDTRLRSEVLQRLRDAGYFGDYKVVIPTSLLSRKDRQE